MPARSSLHHWAAAALLVTAAARTAGAQTAAQPAASAAPVTRWSAHPTGTYLLQLTVPDRVMEVDLTISDSSNTSVATFWPVGDNDGHGMSVTVKEADLILQAMSPQGPVEVVLQRQGDKLTGRWSMGEQRGPVAGHVVKEAKKS